MKLIVNAPAGRHEVTEIGDGGSYFDPSRILWREDENGQLPPRPAGSVLSSDWQTDPMNPSVCWRLKTPAELDAEKVIECTSRLDDKTQRLLFEVNFDQENRVRALEGKPAITKTTYRDALITVWKGLV